MLEARDSEGDRDMARKLFQRGLIACPKNRYVWLSWAVFEAREGYVERARSLLRKGQGLTLVHFQLNLSRV
jgi:hypothetical protein